MIFTVLFLLSQTLSSLPSIVLLRSPTELLALVIIFFSSKIIWFLIIASSFLLRLHISLIRLSIVSFISSMFIMVKVFFFYHDFFKIFVNNSQPLHLGVSIY